MKERALDIANQICREELKRFPKTPILTLAKKIYKENPLLFTSIENVRTRLRTYSGLKGGRERELTKDKSLYREVTYNKSPFKNNPFNIPEAEEESYEPFILPKVSKSILHLQDVHIPYHSVKTIEHAIKFGKVKNIDTILLGYDFLDFYQLSRFQKDPRMKSVKYELETANKILDVFQKEFPKAKIFWRNGNHDSRLENYLAVKAPELLDMSEFKLKALLRLEERGITYIETKRIVKAGKLNIIHGDEFIGSGSGGVNPARALFLKANENTICGHFHKTSEHIERTINEEVVGCWSMGCGCQLHPEYARLNKWNNGFCHIEVYEDGNFHINNMKVIGNRVV